MARQLDESRFTRQMRGRDAAIVERLAYLVTWKRGGEEGGEEVR